MEYAYTCSLYSHNEWLNNYYPPKTSICFSLPQIHYQAFPCNSLFVLSCFFSPQVYFEHQVLLSYLFAMSLLYVYLYQAF